MFVANFAKVKENAIIPSKEREDAGFDLYACFDDDSMTIYPNSVKLVPTGIVTAFSEDYIMLLRERGSTGTKGMALRCGVIDSSYRGEIFVAINNTSDNVIKITKDETVKTMDGVTVYPYKKAIAQAIFLPALHPVVVEIPHEQLLKDFASDRGTGCLGSSGK